MVVVVGCFDIGGTCRLFQCVRCQDKFDLDLSLLARLGGHSQPRTHRGKERFPGMTITYALIQMLEKVAEKTDRARIITKAEVFKLLQNGKALSESASVSVTRLCG